MGSVYESLSHSGCRCGIVVAQPVSALQAARASSNSASINSAGSNGRRSSMPFAEADELDRHVERVDDRDEHAALCRRVELGHDDARELRRFVEELRLRDRVLARSCRRRPAAFRPAVRPSRAR